MENLSLSSYNYVHHKAVTAETLLADEMAQHEVEQGVGSSLWELGLWWGWNPAATADEIWVARPARAASIRRT